MAIILSNLNRFSKFFTGRFCSKYANGNVIKKTINDKLQGSVATHLRCGEVVDNKIKKGLLLSL